MDNHEILLVSVWTTQYINGKDAVGDFHSIECTSAYVFTKKLLVDEEALTVECSPIISRTVRNV